MSADPLTTLQEAGSLAPAVLRQRLRDGNGSLHALAEVARVDADDGLTYAAVCTCGWRQQATYSESRAVAGFNGHRAKKVKRQRVNTAIRFPPTLHERLSIAAAERDLTLNYLVVKACEEFVERLIPADELRLTRIIATPQSALHGTDYADTADEDMQPPVTPIPSPSEGS